MSKYLAISVLFMRVSARKLLAWTVNKVRQAWLIIMGRKSFEMMTHHWPGATRPPAEPMNMILNAVFTKKYYLAIHRVESGSGLPIFTGLNMSRLVEHKLINQQ